MFLKLFFLWGGEQITNLGHAPRGYGFPLHYSIALHVWRNVVLWLISAREWWKAARVSAVIADHQNTSWNAGQLTGILLHTHFCEIKTVIFAAFKCSTTALKLIWWSFTFFNLLWLRGTCVMTSAGLSRNLSYFGMFGIKIKVRINLEDYVCCLAQA